MADLVPQEFFQKLKTVGTLPELEKQLSVLPIAFCWICRKFQPLFSMESHFKTCFQKNFNTKKIVDIESEPIKILEKQKESAISRTVLSRVEQTQPKKFEDKEFFEFGQLIHKICGFCSAKTAPSSVPYPYIVLGQHIHIAVCKKDHIIDLNSLSFTEFERKLNYQIELIKKKWRLTTFRI